VKGVLLFLKNKTLGLGVVFQSFSPINFGLGVVFFPFYVIILE
jgi:hypothetical protein